LLAQASEQARSSRAPRSLRAYESDWTTFAAWCASHQLESLPATVETVAAYLAALYEAGYKDATIDRHCASISVVHKTAGHLSPTLTEQIRTQRKGQRRTAQAPEDKAAPLYGLALDRVLAVCDPNTMTGLRDRALVLVGYTGGFRRGELVTLTVEQPRWTDHGVMVWLGRSKNDQEGEGLTKWLPYSRTPARCPVTALDSWLAHAGITTGAVWRRVDQRGRVGAPLVRGERINQIVKRLAVTAQLPNAADYSAHSLRAGFVTAAAEAGASDRAIARQTGHVAGSRTLHGYVRHSAAHIENAAGLIV
jgi:site-specific recombinase XerD